MAERMGHGQEMTPAEARRRLDELRRREAHGELTVHEAGEITKLLVILGESERGGRA